MKEPLFKCVFVTEGFEKYKNNFKTGNGKRTGALLSCIC